MRTPLPSMKLARQFLALPVQPDIPPLPIRQRFGAFSVGAHSALSVSHELSDGREILCLGTILDPFRPERSDADILAELMRCASFTELERATADLGGRWLLFVRIGEGQRLYGDAGGLKSAFYARAPGGVGVASQPTLLARALGLRAEGDPRTRLNNSKGADAFPPGLTPYAGLRQLLPNHYLDLVSAEAHRFWPTEDIAQREIEPAAREIVALLTGNIRALANRGGRLALALTGGYDSRTLLACCRDLRGAITTFTIVDPSTPLYDMWLPHRLSSTLGFEHHFIRARGPTTEDDLELAMANAGGMWRDPHEYHLPAIGRANADFMLLGNMSEVIRAGYFPYGGAPASIDASGLAALTGWGGDDQAVAACGQWLAGVPNVANATALELFYWESRMGAWSAMECTALDTFVEPSSPYNCRTLLTIGLGVNRDFHRIVHGYPGQSCLLHQRICANAFPQTLREPINRTWFDGAGPMLASLVPASFRSAIKDWRRRLAGAPDR